MSADLIRIEDMSFVRDGKPIFTQIDMQFKKGDITAIMGPSGTGKTTLLSLIGGQLRPSGGDVQLEGQSIAALSRKALFKLRRRMGVLYQHGALFTHYNVYDNVAFPLREHTDLSEDMIRVLVLMRLQLVGLRGSVNLMPGQLSGGMARRVAMARALVLDPDIMMYDEPFTGQDPVTRGVLVKLIRELNQCLGLTSLLVTHDIPETLALADYIYLISGGGVIAQGTCKEIMALAESDLQVKQFMKGLPDGPVPFHVDAVPYAQDLGVVGHD